MLKTRLTALLSAIFEIVKDSQDFQYTSTFHFNGRASVVLVLGAPFIVSLRKRFCSSTGG